MSLPEIILQEAPEVQDLHCYEEIIDEEEEEQEIVYVEPYEVQVTCGLCEERIVFFVAGTRDSVRRLQVLLLDDLRILCRRCAFNSNHG